jgi:cytochrome c biogenesis protein CcmG/thiol:disulfide interchange protein DsbE
MNLIKTTPFALFLLVLILFMYITFKFANQSQPRKMPDATLCLAHDKNTCVATSDLQGNMYIVNFFSTWCHGCVLEHPLWKDIAKRIDVYGIAWKDEEFSVERWLKEHSNPYKLVFKDFGGAFGDKLGVIGVPETFICDASGNLLFNLKGLMDKDIWQNKVLPILENK